MVLIHLKINEMNQFLYETTSGVEIAELLKDLVISKYIISLIVNNLRIKVDLVACALEDLLKHGPMKAEDVRGLKETENIEPDIE
jgi:hypothetical protein